MDSCRKCRCINHEWAEGNATQQSNIRWDVEMENVHLHVYVFVCERKREKLVQMCRHSHANVVLIRQTPAFLDLRYGIMNVSICIFMSVPPGWTLQHFVTYTNPQPKELQIHWPTSQVRSIFPSDCLQSFMLFFQVFFQRSKLHPVS